MKSNDMANCLANKIKSFTNKTKFVASAVTTVDVRPLSSSFSNIISSFKKRNRDKRTFRWCFVHQSSESVSILMKLNPYTEQKSFFIFIPEDLKRPQQEQKFFLKVQCSSAIVSISQLYRHLDFSFVVGIGKQMKKINKNNSTERKQIKQVSLHQTQKKRRNKIFFFAIGNYNAKDVGVGSNVDKRTSA